MRSGGDLPDELAVPRRNRKRAAASGGSQDRLQDLLLAIGSVVAETNPIRVVRAVVDAAAVLVDADYGAFAVLDTAGEISELVQHGLSDDDAGLLTTLPTPAGVLGLLVAVADAVRIDDLATHPVGRVFPEGHPPMGALVGMPIQVGGRVFGVLYLTRRPGRAPFGQDEELQLRALGAQAGLAIANAGAFESGRRREAWLQTLIAVATGLFSGREFADVLPSVATQARHILDADYVAVALPSDEDPASLVVRYAVGDDTGALIDFVVPIEGSLTGIAWSTGTMIWVDDLRAEVRSQMRYATQDAIGPAVFVPLGDHSSGRAVLFAFRRLGRPPFERHAVTMLDAFAAQVAVSLELAARRQDSMKMALLEDRERIARDLHDVVIQRLFAIGLTLEGTTRAITDPGTARRVTRAVDELDQTIKEIRTTIFGLQTQSDVHYGTLRSRAVAVVEQAAPALGFSPSLRFVGLVDTVVNDAIADQVVAVLREALSNVARHARASRIEVIVAVNRDVVTLCVDDDGVGIKETPRRSGLHNMEVRATQRGGRLVLSGRVPSGTHLEWQVPLRPDEVTLTDAGQEASPPEITLPTGERAEPRIDVQ